MHSCQSGLLLVESVSSNAWLPLGMGVNMWCASCPAAGLFRLNSFKAGREEKRSLQSQPSLQ